MRRRILATVLACGVLVRRVAAQYVNASQAVVVLAYCIGGTASYWVIERIAAF